MTEKNKNYQDNSLNFIGIYKIPDKKLMENIIAFFEENKSIKISNFYYGTHTL